MLLDFFEPWQNYLYDANPDAVGTRERTGGYWLSVDMSDDDGNDVGMFPEINDNVFLTGGVTFKQDNSDIQVVEMQLTFAIGTMKPKSEVPMGTYTLNFVPASGPTISITYPINIDPTLPFSDGQGYIPNKGYLKGWADGGTNYRKGTVVHALRLGPNQTKTLTGIYSSPVCICAIGRDGVFRDIGNDWESVGNGVYARNPTAGMTEEQLEAYDDPDNPAFFTTMRLPGATIDGNTPVEVLIWMIGGGGGGMYGPTVSGGVHMDEPICTGGGGGSGYVYSTSISYIVRSSGDESLEVHLGKGGNGAKVYHGFWGTQFFEDYRSDGSPTLLKIGTLKATMNRVFLAEGGEAGRSPNGDLYMKYVGTHVSEPHYESISSGLGGNGQGAGGKGGKSKYGYSDPESDDYEVVVEAGGNGENYGPNYGLGDDSGAAGGGSIAAADGPGISMNGVSLIARGGNGISSKLDWPKTDLDAETPVISYADGSLGGGGGGGTPVVKDVEELNSKPITSIILGQKIWNGDTFYAGNGGGGFMVIEYFKNDEVDYAN